jgi:hydroxypyruvate isomerase
MKGDVIRTIQDHHQYFGHYHTAGVPGSMKLMNHRNYIIPHCKSNFGNRVSKVTWPQEFLPTGKTNEDKIEALKDAVRRCDV